MHRIGLALSGGGFRATLYHLGVVRFLRDADILPKITDINTVSGGSILGAHLVLNWDRYCGSDKDFEEAANEVIQFTQLDVRNRIVRRFPFASTVNILRSLVGLRSVRQLSRAGLLEQHYERFLYGDIPLWQLPDRPRLNILSTNLSEGCLCSFNQRGLLLQRRAPGRRDQFERVNIGLATVPMAVAASSAFPGFFPPLEINGWEVGADEGDVNRQAFTDGAVYDNLGLRMFRCLEQSSIRDTIPLQKEDFLDLEATLTALSSATSLPENSPLRKLREMLDSHHTLEWNADSPSAVENTNGDIIHGLWRIIRSEQLYCDSSFEHIELNDATAQSLLNYVVESGREPDLDSGLWLNRQIVEASLRQVIGKPCLRQSRAEFDGILVSDAGGKFKVTRDMRAGGLIRTALRSSDILMDRVWQLELETFENTPGILFFPITDVVDRSQDQSAPDLEIQRQTARIRTDLDKFSDLEVSALVQHGYCVARKACRTQSETFEINIPSGAPWDPLAKVSDEIDLAVTPARKGGETPSALFSARQLQKSSKRRIWRTLFDLRDWPSYIWIAIIAFFAVSIPYYLYEVNQKAKKQNMVLTAVAQMNPNYRKIVNLLNQGPKSQFEDMPFEDVDSLESPDFRGFEVLSDSRIFDLRSWSEPSPATPAACYTRLRILRTAEGSENPNIRLQRETATENVAMNCPTQSLKPTLVRMRKPNNSYVWELGLNFSHIPIGGRAEVMLDRTLTKELASQMADQGRFNFSVLAKTGLLQIWMLMPEDRQYESFEVSGYPIGQPELAQLVVPHSRVELALGSIVTFRLINPEANYRYECRWTWQEMSQSK